MGRCVPCRIRASWRPCCSTWSAGPTCTCAPRTGGSPSAAFAQCSTHCSTACWRRRELRSGRRARGAHGDVRLHGVGDDAGAAVGTGRRSACGAGRGGWGRGGGGGGSGVGFVGKGGGGGGGGGVRGGLGGGGGRRGGTPGG